MELTVRYFGVLREKTNKEFECFDCNVNETVIGLMSKLRVKYPDLDSVKYKVAINDVLVTSEIELLEGSEISLLPPFAGG